MAVKIRMKRLGRRHRPFFRICVMDSQKPRDGKSIEEVGTYDPMLREKKDRVTLNMERIDYWISVGAQPSDKVATLIKKVRTGTFGTASAPPPMMAPKAPPEPEPAEEEKTEEATTEETTEAATDAAASEESKTEESKAEESTTEETPVEETPTEETAPAETTEKSEEDSGGEKS